MSWFFKSSSKYSPLPTTDCEPSDYAKKAFSFDSAFKFEERGNGKNFKSVFKFDKSRNNMEADYYKYVEGEKSQVASPLILLSYFLTSASYLILFLGFPILFWVCVLTLRETDRVIVFRLGKMTGVKGPGRVVVFPWLDTYKKVDVQASAFSVPPQQFISQDGGIVEMGAEIQFEIVDVETMVKEVADHQDILRSLGRSLMTKVLTKKTISKLTKDRRIAAEDILCLLNEQVHKWGINVREVTLSDPKVLKKPENKSSLNPVLQNLGLRQGKEFPSPQQFVQSQYFSENGEEVDPNADAINTLASAVGGFFTGEGPGVSLLNGFTNSYPPPQAGYTPPSQFVSVNQPIPLASMSSMGIIPPPKNPQPRQTSECFWKQYLENIINQDGLQLDAEAMGLYQINITGTQSAAGQESFIIDISHGCHKVRLSRDCPAAKPNVEVTLESTDLLAVLQGSLSPLQAYLTGRISATGDVKKLMFFDKISSKGHKTGSMFNI